LIESINKIHSTLEEYFLNKRTESESMFKLMELGWGKYQLSKYFIRIIICIVATSFPINLVPWGLKVGSGLTPVLDILIKTILTIILAIILYRLLINKYRNGYDVPIFNMLSVIYIIMQ